MRSLIGRLLQCREAVGEGWGWSLLWPLHLPHVTFPGTPPTTPQACWQPPYLSEPTVAFPHCHLRACSKGLAWILSAQGGHSESAGHSWRARRLNPHGQHPHPSLSSRYRSEDTRPLQELDLLEGKQRAEGFWRSQFDL